MDADTPDLIPVKVVIPLNHWRNVTWELGPPMGSSMLLGCDDE